MSGSGYPAVKVFFAFLLCPLFAGLAVVPLMLLTLVTTMLTRPHLLGGINGLQAFSIFFSTPILAQILFFIPALVMALVVTLLKARGSKRVYLTVSLVGATVAAAWSVFLLLSLTNDGEKARMMGGLMPALLCFVYGGISMGGAAYWVLPKATSESVECANA